MDRHRLGNFRMTRNPSSGDLMLLVSGPTLYKAVLSRAFSLVTFSRTFEDRFGQFDWGTYIRGASPTDEAALADFCRFLQSTIYIDDDLDESFVLSLHTQTSAAGGFERSEIGNLVYEAKPYDRAHHPGSQQRAVDLAGCMAQFIRQHPTYRRSDLIVCVPPSNPNKDFDLPTLLVEEIGKQLGRAAEPRAVRKSRITRPMKDCRTVQEKIDNLADAFAVAQGGSVLGKSVVLIDDIYQTGFSINEVCRTLRAAEARRVLGLVATKTLRDLAETEEESL